MKLHLLLILDIILIIFLEILLFITSLQYFIQKLYHRYILFSIFFYKKKAIHLPLVEAGDFLLSFVKNIPLDSTNDFIFCGATATFFSLVVISNKSSLFFTTVPKSVIYSSIVFYPFVNEFLSLNPVPNLTQTLDFYPLKNSFQESKLHLALIFTITLLFRKYFFCYIPYR